jgi:hypothetical protein
VSLGDQTQGSQVGGLSPPGDGPPLARCSTPLFGHRMRPTRPDYRGHGLFPKIHRPQQSLPDLRLNWENPFAFYDKDGDGLIEMAKRWLGSQFCGSAFRFRADDCDLDGRSRRTQATAGLASGWMFWFRTIAAIGVRPRWSRSETKGLHHECQPRLHCIRRARPSVRCCSRA